jgi:predicted regulator of Ras-like GTPase activity (Roadblock/LC7/MglB family)
MTEQITEIHDKRRRRSADPITAIQLQLQQVMQDFGLDGCVIATTEGLLIAAPESMGSHRAEEIAAIAPLHAVAGTGVETAATDLDGQPVQLHVQGFWALGQELIVAAIGQPHIMLAPGVFRTILGARRIWGEPEKIPA